MRCGTPRLEPAPLTARRMARLGGAVSCQYPPRGVVMPDGARGRVRAEDRRARASRWLGHTSGTSGSRPGRRTPLGIHAAPPRACRTRCASRWRQPGAGVSPDGAPHRRARPSDVAVGRRPPRARMHPRPGPGSRSTHPRQQARGEVPPSCSSPGVDAPGLRRRSGRLRLRQRLLLLLVGPRGGWR